MYHDHLLIYRHWHGPLIGQAVTHLWFSYSSCLFLEFGKLTEGEWFVDRKGERRQYQPEGEWSMTSMESWPTWILRVGERVRASSDSHRNVQLAALRLLIGWRLQSFEISEPTRATRLRFSQALTLETLTTLPSKRRLPHWMSRRNGGGDRNWPAAVLGYPG
jgi:hypothetical protein